MKDVIDTTKIEAIKPNSPITITFTDGSKMNIPEWAKYVARDKDGRLCAYATEPIKGIVAWLHGRDNVWLPRELFPDVKWSDNKSIKISQVLMLKEEATE